MEVECTAVGANNNESLCAGTSLIQSTHIRICVCVQKPHVSFRVHRKMRSETHRHSRHKTEGERKKKAGQTMQLHAAELQRTMMTSSISGAPALTMSISPLHKNNSCIFHFVIFPILSHPARTVHRV